MPSVNAVGAGVALPVAMNPKPTLPPAGRLAFQDTLLADTVLPLWAMLAFQAWLTSWPDPNDQVSCQPDRAVGFPADLFTAVFAVSRMSGWVAHVLEQYGEGRLIRPRAEYIGPVDLEYKPIRKRR